MKKSYRVTVKIIPGDVFERVSRVHAFALQALERKKMSEQPTLPGETGSTLDGVLPLKEPQTTTESRGKEVKMMSS